MTDHRIISWLLEGDVSLQYQVYRDLLDTERTDLQQRISQEGWGQQFLAHRNPDGHWGMGFYRPKWTSSHYTILDLKHLGISPGTNMIRDTIFKILDEHRAEDGGINPASSIKVSDVCINGMFLNYAAYFNVPETSLKTIVDFVLSQQLPDGGFNCHYNRKGARHSSLHSTLSVIEGIREYMLRGYQYRADELYAIERESREFILMHHLYKSDRTGVIIDRKMLMLSYPSRWRYDILRAMDYFRLAAVDTDPRMKDALEVIRNKRRKDGSWPLQQTHSGQRHFDMEKTGHPSRWNTLRAMRVMQHFDD